METDEGSAYVVQVQRVVQNGPPCTWEDVAAVVVHPRTKRKTVIKLGLAKADLHMTERIKARALDVESAREWPVAPFQPPTELRVG